MRNAISWLVKLPSRGRAMGRLTGLLQALGLATAGGLNAYVPLLVVGLLARYTDQSNWFKAYLTITTPTTVLIVRKRVAATNTDVQNAVTTAVQSLTNTGTSSQPAVVAARNDADKQLRDAFQNDQQKIEKLHGTQVDPADRAKLNDTVGAADTKLRARLQLALDDVAVLTLGRNGHDASASPGQAAKQSG